MEPPQTSRLTVGFAAGNWSYGAHGTVGKVEGLSDGHPHRWVGKARKGNPGMFARCISDGMPTLQSRQMVEYVRHRNHSASTFS